MKGQGVWKRGVLLLAGLQLAGCATPFERMWQGLASCEFTDLYVDETGRAANPLLASYTPYKVSDGFAWYKVHEELYGLPVVGFIVPASSFEVHALFVDTSIVNARRLTQSAYGSEFSDEQKHDEGAAPLLLRDPNNPKRSIIDCTRGESEGEQEDPAMPE